MDPQAPAPSKQQMQLSLGPPPPTWKNIWICLWLTSNSLPFLIARAPLFSNSKRLTSTPVAFYAYMSASQNPPSIHHTLIFDVIKTNIGGGYKKHSGMFSAPVAGVYVLTWTIYSGDHGKTAFGIYVNDDMVCSTFGETDDDNGDYDSDTGVIVVSLNQYDDVFIRSIITCSTTIASFTWNTRTTFAGWKLDWFKSKLKYIYKNSIKVWQFTLIMVYYFCFIFLF